MSEGGLGATGQENGRLALLALIAAFGFIFISRGIADSWMVVPLAQWWIDWQGWRSAYSCCVASLLAVTIALPWQRLAGATPLAGQPSGGSADPAGDGLTLRQALRRPEFFELALSFTFTGFSMYMVIVQVVPSLVESGYAPLKAATAFGLAGMLSVGGVISTGLLSHRFGLRPIALLSFACTFVGIFGITQGACGPIVATLSNQLFTGTSAAAIYGVIHACSNIGAGIGTWGAGYLHDVSASYRPALLVTAAGIVVAALPFLLQHAFCAPAAIQPVHPSTPETS